MKTALVASAAIATILAETVRWFTPSYDKDGRQRAQLRGDSGKGGAWATALEK